MATLLGETVDEERVPRDVVEWNDGRDALEVHGHEREEDEKEEGEKEEDEDEDPLSSEMISLEVALKTCCFEGFEGKRMTFLSTTQLTCSNVMSTAVTARPIDTSARRKSHKALSSKASNNQHESSSTTETAMHMYAQPSGPAKKVKKKNGKYQAQLPSFQRSLPALPIPVSRLNRELRDERDKFMAQLQRERADKAALDNWAATKIQASFRGFRARPRVVSYETRKRLNTMSSIRLDLSDMEHSLISASPLVATDDSTDQRGDPAVPAPWRKEIQSRAAHKREFRATKEHRQYAATRAQALVRGFLARCAFARRYARHMDELFHRAIVRIQSMFRAFRLRVRITAVVAKLQLQAAIQIQSLIRGIQARERVLTLTFERKCAQRRRAGEPLQFTLPQRTHEIVRTSCLRVLFAHRKTPQQRAFQCAAWHDERQLLRIYKVSTKLNVQRQWLLRMTLVTPTAKKCKKPRGALTRQPSRFTGRVSDTGRMSSTSSMAMLVNGPSTPTSPSNARRRAPPAGSLSPVSSRPSSPSNTSASLSSQTLLATTS